MTGFLQVVPFRHILATKMAVLLRVYAHLPHNRVVLLPWPICHLAVSLMKAIARRPPDRLPVDCRLPLLQAPIKEHREDSKGISSYA
jgi:hypothetical protein